MGFVDEKIAQLEQEARLQEKEAAETAAKVDKEEVKEPEYLTLEEMIEAVQDGSVTFPNQEKFEFTVRYMLTEQIPVPFIKDVYTGAEENGEAAIFMDHDHGMSQMITLAVRPVIESSIGEWKKQLEEGMQKANSYAEVISEKVLENLDYLIYRTPTGKGWVYNVMFRIRRGSGRVAGCYNCFEKDKKTYGIMLEALVIQLNALLS